MEWLESTIIIAAATLVGLLAYFWQEGSRMAGNFGGERVGALRVPMVGFVGRKRVSLVVRRDAAAPGVEGRIRVIAGSQLSPLDTLALTPTQASTFAGILERAAAECE